jgi:hypothetical protein
MLLRFVAVVVVGITCVILSLAWWPFAIILALVGVTWAIYEVRWAGGMYRRLLEEAPAAAGEAAAGGRSSKHDADCLRRKKTNPYLCTCGLTDAEVRQGLAGRE